MPASADETAPKRRRCSTATREAILAAAARRFARYGYEHAGLREIAADAGVTAALVNRYFGGKQELFAEVIDREFDIHPLIEGEPCDLAVNLARLMVFGEGGDPEDERTPLLLLLRSATEPQAADVLKKRLDTTNLRHLAECLGGPDADARAALIIAQLVGFCTLDQMLRPEAFDRADRERLVELLAASLAAYIG
jgi:AcrR family transcriptional regulator